MALSAAESTNNRHFFSLHKLQLYCKYLLQDFKVSVKITPVLGT